MFRQHKQATRRRRAAQRSAERRGARRARLSDRVRWLEHVRCGGVAPAAGGDRGDVACEGARLRGAAADVTRRGARRCVTARPL
eukprot:5073148-Prymnesium_polylepis.1